MNAEQKDRIDPVKSLREVLLILQERIDSPNATKYITSDLKECWNTISESINQVEQDYSLASKEIEELKVTFQEEIDRWKAEYHRSLNEKQAELSHYKQLAEAQEKVIELYTEKELERLQLHKRIGGMEKFEQDRLEALEALEQLKTNTKQS